MSGALHVHELHGCAPEPLAAYLKALAVLRLLDQRDAGARGWWRGDRFFLAIALDEDGLLEFFARVYEPTPLVTPWNGGSGFYPKDKKDGIDALRQSDAPRFAPYRAAIEQAMELVAGRNEAPKKDDKTALIRACRNRWRGPSEEWLGAALAITGDGEARFPALLGTGGNDGRLDFANNQMQRLVELFDANTGEPAASTEALLRAALFGGVAAGLIDKAIGQFLPGGAGGANATAGFSDDSLFNPWDFVLMLEGTLVFRVAAVRRLGSDDLGQASAPFAVKSQAGGYASASAVDESARGEQWMPLWSRPATLAEVRALFAEGRLQSGRRRARRALDAARAVAQLGAARGVDSFVRFGFIERNGQANLAVPLGRWQVRHNAHVHLLDEIDEWVDALRRASSGTNAPASIERDVRILERAMFGVCREGAGAERWAALLGALGETEDHLLSRPKSTASLGLRPLPKLSLDWLHATYIDSPEWRLAAALASQYADKKTRLGPIRVHCLPLETTKNGYVTGRFASTGEGLARDRRVVWTGRDLVEDLTAIAARRLLDCRQRGIESFELRGHYPARFADIVCFLDARVDTRHIAGMARALMAVSWNEVTRESRQDLPGGTGQRDAAQLPPLYALFRLLYRPTQLLMKTDTRVVLDPRPLRLLQAGRLDDAAQIAIRRVRRDLGRPKLYRALGSPTQARRLAASLCFPLDASGYKQLRRALCYGDSHLDATEASDAPAEF